ncbi:MAG: hypothetical protein HY906_26500 [Deltaproteobacteria bacterium]|nr:hypothetical protein [Deltaproteobacteria bacterium]
MGILDRYVVGDRQRGDDRALREHLARALEDAGGWLRRLCADAARRELPPARLQQLAEITRRADELGGVAEDLAHARSGCWGLRTDGEALAEDERRLSLVLQFDDAMEADVDGLVRAVGAVVDAAAPPAADLGAALAMLDERLATLHQRLRQREELLRNPERVGWPEHTPPTGRPPKE